MGSNLSLTKLLAGIKPWVLATVHGIPAMEIDDVDQPQQRGWARRHQWS